MQYSESSQSLEPTTVEGTREYLLQLQQHNSFRLRPWIKETLLMLNQAPAKRMEAALQKPDNIIGNKGLELERRLSKIRAIVKKVRRDIQKIDNGETPKGEVFLLPVPHRSSMDSFDRTP